MNKRIHIAKYARKCLDASLRRALGKDGMEKLEQKQIKVVYIDGEWWIIGLTQEVGGENA